MTVFFTADTHFGHAGGLSLYRRPFGSVVEMDAEMIARWNAAVSPNDEVWHLGDVAIRYSADRVATLLATLNGTKHLVTGNNDPPATIEQAGWASVQPYAELTLDGAELVLCHYAFRTWRGMSKGSLNLHGHSHGRLKRQPRQVDVGVDVWGFRPVTLSELREPRKR